MQKTFKYSDLVRIVFVDHTYLVKEVRASHLTQADEENPVPMNPVLTPARSQCQNNLTTASAHQGAKTYKNINGQTDTSVSWPRR